MRKRSQSEHRGAPVRNLPPNRSIPQICEEAAYWEGHLFDREIGWEEPVVEERHYEGHHVNGLGWPTDETGLCWRRLLEDIDMTQIVRDRIVLQTQPGIVGRTGRYRVHIARFTPGIEIGDSGFKTLCGQYDLLDLNLDITDAVFDTLDPNHCGSCERARR